MSDLLDLRPEPRGTARRRGPRPLGVVLVLLVVLALLAGAAYGARSLLGGIGGGGRRGLRFGGRGGRGGGVGRAPSVPSAAMVRSGATGGGVPSDRSSSPWPASGSACTR